MFRNAFWFGVALLLSGSTILAAPGVSSAQRGGHVGGANFGGYRGGAEHYGSYSGGYRYGYPYAHYGYGYGRYYPYAGYTPFYYSDYPGLGYDSSDSGSYGTNPYYSGPFDRYYYDTAPPAGSAQAAGNGPSTTSSYRSNYGPADDAAAHVTVNVPADARVWFEDTLTKSTGTVRRFDSPPLTPGERYTYRVRASWNDHGKEVTQTQEVEVRAGANVRVDFAVAPDTADQRTAPPKP
jgi:uncharacterized protein (TIGR03000 family)